MELATHERKILDTMRRIREREEVRASDAGEDREEIGSLLELTGLNKKAFSFVRSLDRMAEEKRSDVLRSLQPLLDLMQPHWNGGQKDWVDEANRPAAEDEPDPAGEAPSDDVIEAFALRGHVESADQPTSGASDAKSEIHSEADDFEASIEELNGQVTRGKIVGAREGGGAEAKPGRRRKPESAAEAAA